MEKWNVEAYLYDPAADAILDRVVLFLAEDASKAVVANQFSMLRSWARGAYPTPEARHSISLQVQHVPTGEMLYRQIYKDGEKFKTRHEGGLITLEASVKIMKEEIIEWLRGTETD